MSYQEYEMLLSQLTTTGNIDANWVLAGITGIAGFFMYMQLRDIKEAIRSQRGEMDELKEEVSEIKTDVAVIKTKLEHIE